MTALDLTVAAANDDAHENSTPAGFARANAEVFATSHTTVNLRFGGGVRFTSVTIPQGATITTAYISVWPTSASTDDANLDMYGEAVDTSVDFLATAAVWTRARTTATAAWVADNVGSGAYINSPSIAAVIQEIVNRGSWASGNTLTLLLLGRADLVKTFKCTSYDGNPAQAAKLHVDYTAGAAIAPPSLALLGVGV